MCYRAWSLNQRDQKAEDELGADVANAISAILNVVADPNSDGEHEQRREQRVAQCRQTCERYGTAKQTASSPMSHTFDN